MRLLASLFSLVALCVSAPALAQTTFPTQYGGRVAGVVPMACDVNGANCMPEGSTGAPVDQIQGNVANGVADSGNPVKIGGRVSYSIGVLSDASRRDMILNAFGGMYTFDSIPTAVGDTFSNSSIGQQYGPGGQNVVPSSAPYVFNGTTWDRQRGDANGTVNQPALSATFWNYAAAAGGILNTTTAVTVKTAAGASVRNYIGSMQCNSEAFTTASELAIRDGAGGTVLWRGKIPTAGWTAGREMAFNPPLRGTANTLTEIVTLTASGAGAVYCNLQGYTGV